MSPRLHHHPSHPRFAAPSPRFAASAVLLAHTEPKLWIANLAETYDLSRLQASAEQGEDGSGDGSGGKEVGCTWKINWKWEVVFVC